MIAQDKPATPAKTDVVRKPLPGGANPSTTLYLVLLTEPDEAKEDIVKNIEKALKYTKAGYSGTPDIKAVSPAFFEEFSVLIDSVTPGTAAVNETLGVKRLPSREVVYELSIDPAQVLKKLDVNYKSGKKGEYIPAGPGEKTELTLTVPGKYAFAPPAGENPKDYTVSLAEFGKPDASKTMPWPAFDKYFVVTLKNYVGNKDELFAALENKTVVTNRFTVKRGDDLQFAFANLKLNLAAIKGDEITIDGIRLTAENLDDAAVKRVWCYFPLDKAGADQAIADFRKDGFRGEELSKEIRKNSDAVGNAKTTINDVDGPKWYELTPASAKEISAEVGFVRNLQVDDLRKLYGRYKTLYKFIVWEFDNGMDPPAAVAVRHPNADVGKVFAIERELQAWRRKAEELIPKDKK